MTLRTTIIAFRPMPVEPLFRFCQSLLGDPESMAVERYRAGEPYSWSETIFHDNNGIENVIDQGLPAILRVEYGADGPLLFDEEDNTPRGALISVSFDTGYGYQSGGAHCGDLHAFLVMTISRYLEEHGASWAWQEESTGEWFSAVDQLARLGDPILGSLA